MARSIERLWDLVGFVLFVCLILIALFTLDIREAWRRFREDLVKVAKSRNF